MKTKEEILDHLAHTVYTHKARKAIVEWLKDNGYAEVGEKIKFASHTYNRDGEQMTKGLDYDDFIDWVGDAKVRFEVPSSMMKSMADNFADAVKAFNINLDSMICRSKANFTPLKIEPIAFKDLIKEYDPLKHKVMTPHTSDDFQIGDWVKYIPTPDESSTECIEAIAHGSDGQMYLCLSNGEYVRPCYCVKYKAQGKERQELIDKLNAVL